MADGAAKFLKETDIAMAIDMLCNGDHDTFMNIIGGTDEVLDSVSGDEAEGEQPEDAEEMQEEQD